MNYQTLLEAAYRQARKSLKQGGLPIGSVLADARGHILARGHNLRWQDKDVTAHAETVCMRHARVRHDWDKLTLVSTLSPCIMCTGTAILFRIPRIVIGESITFQGAEDLFRGQKKPKVELVQMKDERCIKMMAAFIQANPKMWWGDIGIPPREQREAYARWREHMKEEGYGNLLI